MKEEILNKANELVKEYIAYHFVEKSYQYIDYVKENRFLDEIKRDKDVVIDNSTRSEDLAEYAIERIVQNANRSNLLGF